MGGETMGTTTSDFESKPSTPEECIEWRDGDVRRRIRAALSVWSHVPEKAILSTMTLGQLAAGTGVPWDNPGNQGRLVEATNEQKVFFPFDSIMKPPSTLVPAATTVAEWEKVV